MCLNRIHLEHQADKEEVTERRILAPDEHQLELLTELQQRRTMRAHRQEAIRDLANSIIRIVCLIVARYADNHEGPPRHFMWILEVQMRALIIEIFANLTEDSALAPNFSWHSESRL